MRANSRPAGLCETVRLKRPGLFGPGPTSTGLFVIGLLGIALSACSGGGTSLSAATSTPVTAAVATTAAPTTTTTTTTIPPIYSQLTGLPVASEIIRPAVVAKIDNHPNSAPQWGLRQADVVFEELVEGSITRFAAVFHSQDVERIGPIRSARTGDFDLLRNLNQPIFVNSGANSAVWRLLGREDAIVVSDANIGDLAFSRTTDKAAPHNLITSTDLVYAARPGEGNTPPALFQYRLADEPLDSSVSASGVDVDFGAIKVAFRWSAAVNGYERSQNDEAHRDSTGARIAPQNVIVQFVTYGQSSASSITPEPHLVGKGEALIFSGGRVANATWQRASSTAVTLFTYVSGQPVKLTPGSTWVELARTGTATVVS